MRELPVHRDGKDRMVSVVQRRPDPGRSGVQELVSTIHIAHVSNGGPVLRSDPAARSDASYFPRAQAVPFAM